MAHVITQTCCSDANCVSVCPVNCIHPTPEERQFGSSDILHVDPNSCIDCGACADACPVDAIVPADRLAPRDRVFIEINAAFYRDNPDVSSGWTDVRYPTIPRLPTKLRIAVVGTGPAGGYTVATLLGRTKAQITVLDRLPTPGGLVRAGVAPDHPGTKGVLRTFDLNYRHERVRLCGGVDVGTGDGQITPAELAEHFDAVFYAVGASDSRKLGIDGEELPGSMSATELVAFYNAQPGAVWPPLNGAQIHRAVIVGTGNVALDVARILVSDREYLAQTDIADRALALLARQDVREVIVLGRRGRDAAAYTAAEYRALFELPGVQVVVCDSDEGIAALKLSEPPPEGVRRIVFLFQSSPIRITAGEAGTVASVDIATSGIEYTVPTDLVIRSIGYRGTPLGDLPFNAAAGVIANVDGRVVDGDGQPSPGTYVVGWAGRGASGGIGANKVNAISVVERFLTDAAAGELHRSDRTAEDFAALLRARSSNLVSYRGIRAIDQAERRRGELSGRPRVKFTEIAQMVAIARRRRVSQEDLI